MALTPERIERLQDLFERALECPEAERSEFLTRETGDDAALRDDVLALLAAHAGAQTLHRPVELERGAAANDASRWIDQRVGAWRITRLVGAGGMGTVCEAERADEQFRKRVAVKFLHQHALTPIAMQRFRAERQILATLDHPNVATLLDGGVTDDGQPYLVMEFVDGEPITSWAHEHAHEHRARVLLFLQVCDAVEAAHRRLIVHRDLKPGNIFVTRDGRVKLLDFGIARLMDDASALPEAVGAAARDDAATTGIDATDPTAPRGATRFGEGLAYTPAYASPEQMRGEAVGTSTDVFSLGVILFELLAQRLPFKRRTSPDAPAPLAHAEPDLDAILARALQVDVARRYASVQEFRADLERWLDGRTVSARPQTGGYRFAKFVGRHRLGTVVATVAILGILGASGTALWQAQAARRAAGDLRQMNDFLMEVLKMSDPFGEGEELTLSKALDQAADLIDQRFAGRPDLSAQIRFGIGESMSGRYRLEQADAQLARALTESRAVFGEDDVRTQQVRESIAGVRLEQSRFEEAVKGYRGVVESLERHGHDDHPLYAKALGNLGNVYLQTEQYVEADRELQRALAAQQRIGAVDPYDVAGLLSNLAHATHGLEDHARADRYYRDALAAFEKLFPNGSPDSAIVMNNYAMLKEDEKNQAAALDLYSRSLAIRRKVFGARHPMVVVGLSNLARLELLMGDARSALVHAREGAAMADAIYTEPNRFHPSIHGALASALLATGDFTGAQRSWDRAKSLLGTLPEPPPSVVAWIETVRVQLCDRATAERRPKAPPCTDSAGAPPRVAS